VVLGLGLTLALQTRVLRADDNADPDPRQARGESGVLGSATPVASRVSSWRNGSQSAL
jgi:hypothetical protein